jgi:hypothetical protein
MIRRRRLLTLASAVSLLLCVATVVLWVRSYWIGDYWVITVPFWKNLLQRAGLVHIWEIGVSRGWCAITHGEGSFLGRGGRVIVIWHRSYRTEDAVAHTGASRAYLLLAQALVFAALPALWLKLHFRRRDGNEVKCRDCGYNLTGNTSGTCPECASPIPSASEQKSLRPA